MREDGSWPGRKGASIHAIPDGPSAPLPTSRQQIGDWPRVPLPSVTGTGKPRCSNRGTPGLPSATEPLTLRVIFLESAEEHDAESLCQYKMF